VGHGLELTHAVLPTCALARREALEEIGGFDERFLLYYEDLDVAQRLAQAGWLQAIDWDAEAVHVSGGSTSVGARQRWFAQYHRSRGIYMRKHYPRGWPVYAAMWTGKASIHVATWSLRARLRDRRGDTEGAELAREWSHAFRASIGPAVRPGSEQPDDGGEPAPGRLDHAHLRFVCDALDAPVCRVLVSDDDLVDAARTEQRVHALLEQRAAVAMWDYRRDGHGGQSRRTIIRQTHRGAPVERRATAGRVPSSRQARVRSSAAGGE